MHGALLALSKMPFHFALHQIALHRMLLIFAL